MSSRTYSTSPTNHSDEIQRANRSLLEEWGATVLKQTGISQEGETQVMNVEIATPLCEGDHTGKTSFNFQQDDVLVRVKTRLDSQIRFE